MEKICYTVRSDNFCQFLLFCQPSNSLIHAVPSMNCGSNCGSEPIVYKYTTLIFLWKENSLLGPEPYTYN